MKNILLFTVYITYALSANAQTVTDIDGNIYNTVTIGTQVWLAENLKTTKYSNGDPIPNITDDVQWLNLTTGAYCDYNNLDSYSKTYGCLYNWYTLSDSRNIAPMGWHVATDTEWTTLTIYLGNNEETGGKLKETGTTHWNSPNTGATDETGFTALPGGYRYHGGFFGDVGKQGYWWTSSEDNPYTAWIRSMGYKRSNVGWSPENKKDGMSVRCVKDSNTTLNYVTKVNALFIYPNPSNNILYIKNAENEIIRVSILSLEGTLLKQFTEKKINAIDISNLQNGIYIIKIENLNDVFFQKIIKR